MRVYRLGKGRDGFGFGSMVVPKPNVIPRLNSFKWIHARIWEHPRNLLMAMPYCGYKCVPVPTHVATTWPLVLVFDIGVPTETGVPTGNSCLE
jgi:hypothetical protein